MRLAAHLGMTRREILMRMDSNELSLWLAWDRIEPIGQPWLQAAHQLSMMANLWGDGRRRWTAEDFLPIPRRPREQTAAEGLAIIDGLMAAQRE